MTERDLLAAEHALGLLEGEQLMEARGLAASDADFAAAVEQWTQRFAPLFDSVAERAAPAGVWRRIEAALSAEQPSEVVALRRRVRQWQWATGLAAAAAVALIFIAPLSRGSETVVTPPTVAAPAAPLVAALTSEDKQMLLTASYDRSASSLTVAPGQLSASAGHSHELWIIPADGKPRSLGLVQAGAPRRLAVPAALAGQFAEQATLAISVEPEGGSPGDGPTGPVIASGALLSV